MCDPMILMAASTAVSVLGSINQGRQQQAYAKYQAAQAEQQARYQAAQLEADAKVERDTAALHAEKIRKAGALQRSQARAALAGSGVDVGEGSAITIDSDITQESEKDAWTAMLDGEAQGKRLQAQAGGVRISGANEAAGLRISGSNARTAANFAAFGTALGGAAQTYDAWKRSKTPGAT